MPRRAPSPSSRRRSSLPSAPSTPRASLTHQQPRQPKFGVLAAAANRLRDVTATPRRSVSGRAAQEGEQAPLVVESQRYEEWMKIATDNKITSTNTWNLALIDYFHDMSLLRNGDDNSINFQKASCTLDGCVKIWTSRVDSVASETGKLLSGLGDKAGANGEGDADEEDGDGEEDAERQEKRARKRAARQTSTLADDFSKLRIKAFDLEFTVDPLFKKTSADFDEGGAGGILMNHLGCDGNMKVVFDAGDAKLECDEEDADADAEEEKKEDVEEEADVEVDISRLRARCLPQGLSPLTHMSLCPSLSAFRFSADSSLSLSMLNLGSESDDESDAGGVAGGGLPQMTNGDGDFGGFDDHFAGQEFGGGGDDFGGGEGGEVDFFADQFTPLGASNLGLPLPGPSGSTSSSGVGFGPIEPFDPRLAPSRSDLVLSNAQDEEGEGGNVWELLDSRYGGKKGWAGPEHWKMRRGRVGGAAGGGEKGGKKEEGEEDDAPTDAKPTRTKRDRAALVLDFSLPPATSSKELFLPAAPKSSITTSLSKKKNEKAEEDWTLPEDYMFSSGMLLRLFLKPKTTLRMRRRPFPSGAGLDPSAALGGTNEAGAADVQFWAQAGGEGDAMGMGMGMEGDMGGMDPMDHDFGGGPDNDDDDPPPFDTQWLVSGDTDDLPDPDADIDTDANLPDDLAAATEGQLRRVRPEQVTYAKRAKRVDVKKLKDSIWRELEEVVVPVKQFPAAHVYDPTAPPPDPVADENASPAARPKKPKKSQRAEALVPVISSLRKQYPKEKMDEISTSYLFICLLHLANEKGLRIQTPRPASEGAEEVGVEEGEEMRKLVGGLEGLRVLKEVQA
ncbi:Condensin complex subunit 2 [Rhodotorula toruloides]|uniref:Condensin complex subunit 2 n=1 Tax=Rhodotorula toruloides TaxID=5286 RepID=A0A0K3CQ07_RHOTO|nr:Condensin complex subunit 2 [Rhodotorula toruloides]PRQ70550.1 Condensin complex subunit 2-domain containing protein [Rhodotorula toruloides]